MVWGGAGCTEEDCFTFGPGLTNAQVVLAPNLWSKQGLGTAQPSTHLDGPACGRRRRLVAACPRHGPRPRRLLLLLLQLAVGGPESQQQAAHNAHQPRHLGLGVGDAVLQRCGLSLSTAAAERSGMGVEGGNDGGHGRQVSEGSPQGAPGPRAPPVMHSYVYPVVWPHKPHKSTRGSAGTCRPV